MTRKKVAITGSRSIGDYDLVEECLDRTKLFHGANDVQLLIGDARGVDAQARMWAKKNYVAYDYYEAEWDDIEDKPDDEIGEHDDGSKYWKMAGLERNTQLVEDADAVLAIWDGSSNGTRDTIQKARDRNMDLDVFRTTVSGEEIDELVMERPSERSLKDFM